jgi:O-antigen/teichoic acid export membrane protein
VLSLLAGGLLAVLLPWLLPLVYGADFQAAIFIALILLPGLVLAGIGDIINQALRGQGQPVAGVVSKLLGLVIMGIVGVSLAGIWGGKGIACGYLAGELVAFTDCCWSPHGTTDAAWHTIPTRADVTFAATIHQI